MDELKNKMQECMAKRPDSNSSWSWSRRRTELLPFGSVSHDPGSGLARVLAQMNLAEVRFKVLVQCAFMRIGGIAVECFSFKVSTTQGTSLWLMRAPARLKWPQSLFAGDKTKARAAYQDGSANFRRA
jgi:hypothetical protein